MTRESCMDWFHRAQRSLQLRSDISLTVFEQWDKVEIRVGPATGKFGYVVAPRNGNLTEPYWGPSYENIGVASYEDRDVHPIAYAVALHFTGSPMDPKEWVVRWFDSPDQLKLVERSPYSNPS